MIAGQESDAEQKSGCPVSNSPCGECCRPTVWPLDLNFKIGEDERDGEHVDA